MVRDESRSKASGAHRRIVKEASGGEVLKPLVMVRNSSRSMWGHSVGIAHTRWATVGGISDTNTHPHVDASGKIAVVHNGSIFNRADLKRELTGMGYKFDGQTDTEIVAKLIGHYSEDGRVPLDQAVQKAVQRLQGTWGLVVMSNDSPEELVVTSHGSPLYIGVGSEGTFVASNPAAFKGYSPNFIKMEDMEVATITVDGRNLDMTRMVEPETRWKEINEEQASPAPYPHWFIKEVMEQPQSIGRALGDFGGRLFLDKATLGGLDENYDRIKNIESLKVMGAGSSLNAAAYGTKLLRHTGAFTTVQAVDANSYDDADFRQLPGTDPAKSGLIVLSGSGETKDVLDATMLATNRLTPVISIVNSVGSSVAKMTKCGVYCHAGPEVASTSTKVFTSQVVCMALAGMWFGQTKAKEKGVPLSNAHQALAESLQRLPISFGILKGSQAVCKKAARKLLNKEHCFVLGKGYGEPIAMEGALKLKEIGYLHAEGYSGGALKHGPFAMIEDDENGKQGATPIIIPSNGPLTALGAVMPLQMIAYELAMLKDSN